MELRIKKIIFHFIKIYLIKYQKFIFKKVSTFFIGSNMHSNILGIGVSQGLRLEAILKIMDQMMYGWENYVYVRLKYLFKFSF